MSTFLEAALRYAAVGLPVLPLHPRGKTPAVARGFYAATTNAETIKRLWRIADNNIGIRTGAISGVWVLDIDGRSHYSPPRSRTLAAAVDAHGDHPARRSTPLVQVHGADRFGCWQGRTEHRYSWRRWLYCGSAVDWRKRSRL
jgi:hypothetical protein